MMTDNEEFLDKDGYPTDEALDKKSFFEFIKSLWCWKEYFDEKEDEDEIFKHPTIRYHISPVVGLEMKVSSEHSQKML